VVGLGAPIAQRQTTPIRRAAPPGENLSMKPTEAKMPGPEQRSVALDVGIEAGIHNFRRISYRLFLWPSFLTYAGFPQLTLGRSAGPTTCRKTPEPAAPTVSGF